MKKILIIALSFFMFQITALAADPELVVSCPSGGTVQSTLKCTVKVKAEASIKEVSLNYDFGESLSFISYAPASNFEAITNNSSGFDVKNENGVTGEFSIGTVSFKLLKAGNFALKTIKIVDIDNATYTASGISQPIRILSEDNTLKSLSISPGKLTPEFQPEIETYKAEVDAASITITAEANDSKATYKSSSKQNLSYGENTINFIVTSESGSKRTYKLIITRKDDRSTNNTLKNISLSIGDISFQPTTTAYTVKIDPKVTKVKISAEIEDNKSSFVSGYGPREISLLSEKTIAELRVKAENGVIRIYTLTFLKTDRELSSNNNIKELTLEGYTIDFKPNVTSYDVKVKNGAVLNFKVALEDENARYELVNGDLKNGNTVIIKVTAENGDVKEYKFNITTESSETTTTKPIETKKTETSSFMSEFLCSDDSIIYYLIVFVVGMILSALIMSAVYTRKIRKLENQLKTEKENHRIPVSEQTEKLYFDDFDQNNTK